MFLTDQRLKGEGAIYQFLCWTYEGEEALFVALSFCKLLYYTILSERGDVLNLCLYSSLFYLIHIKKQLCSARLAKIFRLFKKIFHKE